MDKSDRNLSELYDLEKDINTSAKYRDFYGDTSSMEISGIKGSNGNSFMSSENRKNGNSSNNIFNNQNYEGKNFFIIKN